MALALFTFFKRLALPLHTLQLWQTALAKQLTFFFSFSAVKVDISSCYSWAHLSVGILIPLFFILCSTPFTSIQFILEHYCTQFFKLRVSDARTERHQQSRNRRQDEKTRGRKEQTASPIASLSLLPSSLFLCFFFLLRFCFLLFASHTPSWASALGAHSSAAVYFEATKDLTAASPGRLFSLFDRPVQGSSVFGALCVVFCHDGFLRACKSSPSASDAPAYYDVAPEP